MTTFTSEKFVDLEKYLTSEMIPAFNEFREQAEREYLYCDAMYKKCDEIDTSLPQTSASGRQMVSCNRNIIVTIKHYWEARRDLVKNHLSDDWIIEHGGHPSYYRLGH